MKKIINKLFGCNLFYSSRDPRPWRGESRSLSRACREILNLIFHSSRLATARSNNNSSHFILRERERSDRIEKSVSSKARYLKPDIYSSRLAAPAYRQGRARSNNKQHVVVLFCVLALFLSGFYFPAKTLSEEKDLVANVLNFRAVPGDSHATLSWVNPKEEDFSSVRIQRGLDTYPSGPKIGDNIYEGRDTDFVDLGLVNNQVYFYTIFVISGSGLASSGSIAQARPAAPSLLDPYKETSPLSAWIITTEAAPKAAAKKEKIELSDFSYYFLFDKHPVKIGLSDLKQLHVVKNSLLLFEISADIFVKPVNVITLSNSESSYLMKLLPDKNKYQVVISAPQNKGDFELRLIIVYQDKTISDLKTRLLVDPQGYVYEQGSIFLGFGHRGEIRLENAQIMLFEKKDGNWQKWEAEQYYQKNPVTTDNSGEYAFFVPNGEYYLEVKKQGYFYKKTEPFKVEDQLISKNIQMTPIFKGWHLILVIIVFLAIISLVLFLIIRRKRHNKFLRQTSKPL